MKHLVLGAVLAALLLPVPGSGPYSAVPVGMPERVTAEMYRRFLQRAPDAGARSWMEALRNGESPNVVASQILGSDEYYRKAGETIPGFVKQLHLDLTGRPPGPAETHFWVNRVYSSDRREVAFDMLRRYPQNWVPPGELYPYRPASSRFDGR